MKNNYVKEIALSKNKRRKTFLYVILGILSVLLILLIGGSIYVLMVIRDIPPIDKWMEIKPSQTTIIYSSDNKILGRLYKENRIYVPLYKISPYLQQAVVVSEDKEFYTHSGVSIRGLIRAIIVDLLHLEKKQGGSTITQQVAELLFLSPERTINKKIKKIYIAIKLEKFFTKQQILEMYLNLIYWGHGTYGAEAASQYYFGKSASELTIPEAALLAGIIPAPENLSPYKNPEKALALRNIVIEKLYQEGYINQSEYEKAIKAPLKVIKRDNNSSTQNIAPYFFDYVLKELINKFGKDMVYSGGLKVYTTLDTNLQRYAESSLKKIISQYGKKYKVSQGALLAIDPNTGYIKAWVGGIDYSKSQFDRVSMAVRQPGSAFKPFVYLTALQKGFQPYDLIEEREVTYTFNKKEWKPKNYDGKLHGTVTLQEALENSYNIATILLLEEIGVSDVIRNARRLGIESPLEPSLALALGTSGVTLYELVRAYCGFANGGNRVTPIAILRVEDSKGNIIYNSTPEIVPVIEKDVDATLVKMMKRVITNGTGKRANIGRPAAGKTGTTDDYRDAWFIGFTPDLCAGVWMGNDDYTPTNKVPGGLLPAMTWKEFMQNALKDVPPREFYFLIEEKTEIPQEQPNIEQNQNPTYTSP
ncbi:PBP1A family penicillin-binding protein [Dictyoglomus thermophilum]|uniref:transglycosylase domain-containing protein n=1 Tax=Dictyoglomus thermophilum TaxID=14 RepID=UPI0011EADDBE|nr:PBP1A family penicillin-binding protein [Dictyoglomus thermophilum]TYT22458.1 PBP1A family penicillin-binding protein [Dictyoglomus thermophilum]